MDCCQLKQQRTVRVASGGAYSPRIVLSKIDCKFAFGFGICRPHNDRYAFMIGRWIRNMFVCPPPYYFGPEELLDVLKIAVLCVAVYCCMALMLTDSLFSPIVFVKFFWEQPDAIVWHLAFWGGASIAWIISLPFGASSRFIILQPAIVLAGWMAFSVAIAGCYANARRERLIAEFHPDEIVQNSFFTSLKEAPGDFRFYVHAAVIKDCIPYMWSYRYMTLVRLNPNVAIDVLPREWISRCGIKATRH